MKICLLKQQVIKINYKIIESVTTWFQYKKEQQLFTYHTVFMNRNFSTEKIYYFTKYTLSESMNKRIA